MIGCGDDRRKQRPTALVDLLAAESWRGLHRGPVHRLIIDIHAGGGQLECAITVAVGLKNQ